MRWSKLKQRIEDGFAESAKGRVEVWSTRYRKAHDQAGEAWITIDGQRVHSVATLTHLVERYQRSLHLQKARETLDTQNSAEVAQYFDAHYRIEDQLREEGIASLWEVTDALSDYLNMSLEQILQSEHLIVRALGMFDRRLGKRRLAAMDVSTEHELVRGFYHVRCAFEGSRAKPGADQEN